MKVIVMHPTMWNELLKKMGQPPEDFSKPAQRSFRGLPVELKETCPLYLIYFLNKEYSDCQQSAQSAHGKS